MSLIVAHGLALAAPEPASSSTFPGGFAEEAVIGGLDLPTDVAFADDGRVFVAEKAGVVKVYDGLEDSTPTVFADLRPQVHEYLDRGLMGLALPPGFPGANPYVYVAYTYNGVIGGPYPKWRDDECPQGGCIASGRISRLRAVGNSMTGSEDVLVHDWCGQYALHTLDTIAFGPDGQLYASAGESASPHGADRGSFGTVSSRCPDPSLEGGALRSQDVRTSSDPTGLSGSVIRIDPDTGHGLASNPLGSSLDQNERRLIAYGLRNPFRFDFRPGTDELWLGDVGWNSWEELDRIADVNDRVMENFGWPCYEGSEKQAAYDGLELPLCESLYEQGGGVTSPYYEYAHGAAVTDDCPAAQDAAISAVAFYQGGDYPDAYDGALFFGEYSSGCLWVMKDGGSGPTPSGLETFGRQVGALVSLKTGPGGDLFYVDIQGSLRRVRYSSGNTPPSAVATANPRSGPLPLDVRFDASESSDPEGGPLLYEWDLDGDGQFDDARVATPTKTYTEEGAVLVQLRVTDGSGASTTDSLTITPGNSAPRATITRATGNWHVGQRLTFEGRAVDPEQGLLPARALSWSVVLHHCAAPDSCHEHPLLRKVGVTRGSLVGPEHGYPAYLTITLTARDEQGLTNSDRVRLDPRTVDLTMVTSPVDIPLVVNSEQVIAPFVRRVIAESTNLVAAPLRHEVDGSRYLFFEWSDRRAAIHNVRPVVSTTYGARYRLEALGTENPDRLSGTRLDEAFRTFGGGDLIRAAGGSDEIRGGRGPDRIYGDAGSDAAAGGPGGDVIRGGAGRDDLLGGPGADKLVGGDGRDALAGGGGADRFDALDGAGDRIRCGPGRDRVTADRRDRVAASCEAVRRR